jgi:hypothetical protein
MDKHAARRLYLLICMSLLAGVAGFVWGQRYGYSQGKTDMLRLIEQRTTQPAKVERPV